MRLLAPGLQHCMIARRAENQLLGLVQEVRQQTDCEHYLPAKLAAEGKLQVLPMENFLRRKHFELPVGLGNRPRLEPERKDLEKPGTCPMRTPEEPAQGLQGRFLKLLELALSLALPTGQTAAQKKFGENQPG